MQLSLVLAFSAALAVTGAAQERMAPNASHDLTSFTSGTVKVYKLDQNLTAPELIPRDYSTVLSADCQRTESVKKKLMYVVDPAGNVHEVQLPPDADAYMTLLLFQYMQTVHFKPAQWNGSPVAVGLTDTISFQVCYMEAKNESGKTGKLIKLNSAPDHLFASWNHAPAEITLYHAGPDGKEGIEHIGRGAGVTPPMPVHTVDPPYTDYARTEKIQGTVTLQIIVDTKGLPQNVHVLKPIGYGLDQNAVETVRKFRFKPALKDGKPVAVYMTIAINFRLY